jgi:hypothetical protein
MAYMKCPEKENLQLKCTNRWNEYVAAIHESRLAVDPSSGTIKPLSISELVEMSRQAARPGPTTSGMDPGIGMPWITTPYSAALRRRWEHLRASMELSKHLSRHRC